MFLFSSHLQRKQTPQAIKHNANLITSRLPIQRTLLKITSHVRYHPSNHYFIYSFLLIVQRLEPVFSSFSLLARHGLGHIISLLIRNKKDRKCSTAFSATILRFFDCSSNWMQLSKLLIRLDDSTWSTERGISDAMIRPAPKRRKVYVLARSVSYWILMWEFRFRTYIVSDELAYRPPPKA